MVPYVGRYLGREASLMKYVLGQVLRWYWASLTVSMKTSLTSGS